MADATCQASPCAIIAHAKAELRQQWAPAPIPHGLLKKGWHNLPPHKWRLPAKIAYPVKRVKPAVKRAAVKRGVRKPKVRDRNARAVARQLFH